jgi:hypothetical protein
VALRVTMRQAVIVTRVVHTAIALQMAAATCAHVTLDGVALRVTMRQAVIVTRVL